MEAAAYSTIVVMLALVVFRPRIGNRFRVTPAVAACAAMLVMLVLGIVGWAQIELTAHNLWRPFVAIASIMVMTEVAQRIGLLDVWASHVEARAHSTERLFLLVFLLGVVTSATLNNDAAILLLTPLVVSLVRRRYPDRPRLILPFAFAVFMSAGVAAMPVSNPMNMVVANMAGIRFNAYAARMLPAAIVCWILSYQILKRIFRSYLQDGTVHEDRPDPQPTNPAQIRMMLLLGAVLLAYPVIGYLGGAVWAIAACGGAAALILFHRTMPGGAFRTVLEGVSWDTLIFLLAVLVISMGLREVGLVARMAQIYEGAGVATVGSVSAIGSAMLNNHPMSHLNMFALKVAQAPDVNVLAALIGGDLGPRLLPIGSLAGLLWFELLHRKQVEIRLSQFVLIGVVVTIPCLTACLVVLAWLPY